MRGNTPNQTTPVASAASSLDATWASQHAILEHDKADAITAVKNKQGVKVLGGWLLCLQRSWIEEAKVSNGFS